jgi:SAM-dependent methyltransferase
LAKITPFEKHTQQYEKWFERHRHVYESELVALQEALPGKGDGVEIGVGSARFAQPLGISTGVEPSAKMRKLAHKRGINAIEGIAEAVPFANETYDFVLMVTAVCFLDNVGKSFQEAYRILKSGGCILIGFVDKDTPLGKEYQAEKNENKFYREATFYSTGELVSHLKKAGFSDFSFYQTIFKPLSMITAREPVTQGYGKGAFVVIKGIKKG